MYIILPNERNDLDALVSKIDSSTLQRTQILMQKTELTVSVPKFKFTNTIPLSQILKDVGIQF